MLNLQSIAEYIYIAHPPNEEEINTALLFENVEFNKVIYYKCYMTMQ